MLDGYNIFLKSVNNKLIKIYKCIVTALPGIEIFGVTLF